MAKSSLMRDNFILQNFSARLLNNYLSLHCSQPFNCINSIDESYKIF